MPVPPSLHGELRTSVPCSLHFLLYPATPSFALFCFFFFYRALMRACGSGHERPGMGHTGPSSEVATGTPGAPPELPDGEGAAPPVPATGALAEGTEGAPAEPP